MVAVDVSTAAPLHSRDLFSKVTLRKLHLLNIICRKFMLSNQVQRCPGSENSDNSKTVFFL